MKDIDTPDLKIKKRGWSLLRLIMPGVPEYSLRLEPGATAGALFCLALNSYYLNVF